MFVEHDMAEIWKEKLFFFLIPFEMYALEEKNGC